MNSRIAVALLTLLVSATLAVPAPVGAATSAAKACKTNNTKLGLLTALNCVPVAEERIGGYKRSLFKHWIDANGNGKDTRAEVLIAESLVSVRFSSTGKTVSTGKWLSLYDGETWTLASDVDVDHVVALAEAWRSVHATPKSFAYDCRRELDHFHAPLRHASASATTWSTSTSDASVHVSPS